MFVCIMDCAVVCQARCPWTRAKDDPSGWLWPLPPVVFQDMLELTGLGWLDLRLNELRFIHRLRGVVIF